MRILKKNIIYDLSRRGVRNVGVVKEIRSPIPFSREVIKSYHTTSIRRRIALVSRPIIRRVSDFYADKPQARRNLLLRAGVGGIHMRSF